MKLTALSTLLLALYVAEQGQIVKASSSPAFLRSTRAVATWNRLQQTASVASGSRSTENDDDDNDHLVIPAFYRASSYEDILSMQETKYAYDRHRATLQTQPQTELEFLEDPGNRGR